MEASNERAFADVSQDPYRILVRMPFLPPCNEANNEHWTVGSKRGRTIRRFFATLVPDSKRPEQPLRRAAVTCIRYVSPTARRDYDGLVRSFKLVIDCLSSPSLNRRPILKDDSYNVIGQPRYRWEPTLRGRGYIEVIVEDRAPWIVSFR